MSGLNLFSQAKLTYYRADVVHPLTHQGKASQFRPATKCRRQFVAATAHPGQQAYPTDWPRVLYLAHVLYSIRDLTGNDNPAAGWKLACVVDHIEAMKPLYRLSNGGRSRKSQGPTEATEGRSGQGRYYNR